VATARRHIWLCADDYGISRSVNAAIRDLILRGRLNATSVMTAAPHFDAEEAEALDELNSGTTRADADRAVQAAERWLQAARPRPFPAAQQDDARGDDAAAQRGTPHDRGRHAG
jgi:hypothetical protein